MLFLGAGASAPADVPLTRAFVDTLRWDLETREGVRNRAVLLSSYDRLVAFLTDYVRARAKAESLDVDESELEVFGPDIELVYEALVRLSDPESDALLHGRRRFPVMAPTAERLKLAAERHIREKAFLAPEQVAYLDELIGLCTLGRVTVFSTNYDTGVEALCERHGLRWEDGFRVRWDHSVFDEPDVDVCLHKLHGSVLWYRDQLGGYLRSPLRPTEADGERLRWFGGSCDPMLVYPARKSAQDAPYAFGMAHLSRTLGAPETEICLLVIGYSFRDAHLRQILFDAARTNTLLTVVLVAPDAGRTYESVLAKYGEGPSPLSERVLCVNEGLDDSGAVLENVVRRRVGAFQVAHRQEREFRQSRSRNDAQARAIAENYARAGDSLGFDRCISMHRSLRPRTDAHNDLTDSLVSLRLALQNLRSGSEIRSRVEAFGAQCEHALGEFHAAVTDGNRDTWHTVYVNCGIPSNASRAIARAAEEAEWWTGQADGRVRLRMDAFRKWVHDFPPLFAHCKQESGKWTLAAANLVSLDVLPQGWVDQESRGTPDEFADDVGAGLMRLLRRRVASQLVRLVQDADADASA